MGNVLVAQMLYLANEDLEADITLYINSPGGSVSAGMAIYDTMQFIPCDVRRSASVWPRRWARSYWAPARRASSLPNWITSTSSAARSQAADIEIQAKEILFTKAVIAVHG